MRFHGFAIKGGEVARLGFHGVFRGLGDFGECVFVASDIPPDVTVDGMEIRATQFGRGGMRVADGEWFHRSLK
jgi:hypothetical protein